MIREIKIHTRRLNTRERDRTGRLCSPLNLKVGTGELTWQAGLGSMRSPSFWIRFWVTGEGGPMKGEILQLGRTFWCLNENSRLYEWMKGREGEPIDAGARRRVYQDSQNICKLKQSFRKIPF